MRARVHCVFIGGIRVSRVVLVLEYGLGWLVVLYFGMVFVFSIRNNFPLILLVFFTDGCIWITLRLIRSGRVIKDG